MDGWILLQASFRGRYCVIVRVRLNLKIMKQDVGVEVFTCKYPPGVLRGIDMARGLYFLLTPVDPSVLRNVNCLLLGAISLPSCILTTQVRYITSRYWQH